MADKTIRQRPDGTRITEGDLRHGIRISIAASSLAFVWVSLTQGMPLTMFMECLGASGVLIGLVTTVTYIASVAQIPGAMLFERLPSRKPWWIPVSPPPQTSSLELPCRTRMWTASLTASWNWPPIGSSRWRGR